MVHLSRFRPKTLRVVPHKNILLSDQACTGPETLRVVFPIRHRICATKLFVGFVMRLICTPVTWCHVKICVFVSAALCSICSLLNPNGLDLIWSVIHGSHLGVNPAHVCDLFTVLARSPFFSPFTMSSTIIFNFRSRSFCYVLFRRFPKFPRKCSKSISGERFIRERKQIVIHFDRYVTTAFHFYPLKV